MKPNQCHHCGKFAKYEEMDSYTPFGCSNPASPEPYDPTFLCGKCSNALYDHCMKIFADGSRYGDWQKSNAERRAAKDSGLVWVHSHGVKIDGRYVAYYYVKESEIDKPEKP
jgi:hypothetical protein